MPYVIRKKGRKVYWSDITGLPEGTEVTYGPLQEAQVCITREEAEKYCYKDEEVVEVRFVKVSNE